MKLRRKTKPVTGTQAVQRAVSILKSFREEKASRTLMEIARELGLNKTTAYRLLTALEMDGLVARDPVSDAYTLGPELIVLGGMALRSSNLRISSRAELKKLSAATGETTSLEVLSGTEVLIIDEIAGEHLMGGTQSIGTRWPAYATSTGKAILAYLSGEEVDAILKKPLAQLTKKTITDPDVLRKELGVIRQRGFAVADEQMELGYVAVGSPVFNHDGEVTAAISVGGPTIRLTRERIIQTGTLVCATAERISKRLGYRG